jgi:hypothetical protein
MSQPLVAVFGKAPPTPGDVRLTVEIWFVAPKRNKLKDEKTYNVVFHVER